VSIEAPKRVTSRTTSSRRMRDVILSMCTLPRDLQLHGPRLPPSFLIFMLLLLHLQSPLHPPGLSVLQIQTFTPAPHILSECGPSLHHSRSLNWIHSRCTTEPAIRTLFNSYSTTPPSNHKANTRILELPSSPKLSKTF
jgi:hypothetical protein